MSNKTVIITGSTSGIGLGIAKIFASSNANLVINGFADQETLNNITNELKSLGAGEILYHSADLSKPEEIDQMFNQVTTKFDRIDALVNNAGIQFVSPVEDFPADKWDAIIKINLTAAFHTTKHVVPIMKKQQYGRIINIASAHGLVASPFKSAYIAAKHGIVGFTKSVALELAQYGITVNSVCPGYVKTPLVLGQVADTAKARGISEEDVVKNVLLRAQATKRFVEIEEVAALVHFLCSDQAKSITGSALTVDGGWTAGLS